MSTLATTNLKNASSGSNNIVLNTDGTTTIAAPSNIIKSGTAVASTSGVAIDFNGLPSWVKRVTVMFNGVSTNGTSQMLIQLGAGSVTTSGYSCRTTAISGANSTNANANANGFGCNTSTNAAAAAVLTGQIIVSLLGSNTWAGCGSTHDNTSATVQYLQAGSVTLSGTLDRVRITTVNGTDTFDAGSINILYEG